jgi:hypothetical protein
VVNYISQEKFLGDEWIILLMLLNHTQ